MNGWKKGRGALGVLAPLIGSWTARPGGPEPASQAKCTRRFERIWNGAFIRLDAQWSGMGYEEMALFGKDSDGTLAFWSFTSDGKRSQGKLADASDIHPDAIAFEAEMPAGLARFAYWPGLGEGFDFAVESRTKRGWNRFLLHHYHTN
ncbi:hypothetical protein HNP52_002585 [Sphingomonas kyeonggiensis]|uniref:DUF1579 domain-containing protein n=1 Tax=Sphingomonas kyeonggiensis TaxID=1268553 RepID=A0A7W7K1W9_9SPHN|nr:hypothetical protein [Sphingomonas kyeonggiensis]MBB4839516.1 hypothetical protein [Sphingomonas kyeonggiensis]